MLKKIDFIEPTSLGKTLAALFFCLGIAFFVIYIIQLGIAKQVSVKGILTYGGFVMTLPLSGFCLGTFLGYAYNFSASLLGGIEIGFKE